MKRPPKLAPWVLERPHDPDLSRLDKVMRVVLVLCFLSAIAIVGGQIYQHLMAEVFGF